MDHLDSAETFYNNWYREPLIRLAKNGILVPTWSGLSKAQKQVWTQIRANVNLAANTIRDLKETIERNR